MGELDLSATHRLALFQLHRDRTEDIVQVLLGRALWERFRKAEERGDTNIETPFIKPSDFAVAHAERWKYGPPPGCDDHGIPAWMKCDAAGLPFLPSACCTTIRTAIETSQERDLPSCRADDLYERTVQTLEELLVGHEDDFEASGFLLVRNEDVPALQSAIRSQVDAESDGSASKIRYEGGRRGLVSLKRAMHAETKAHGEIETFYHATSVPPPSHPARWMDNVLKKPPKGVLTFFIVEPEARRVDSHHWMREILTPGPAMSKLKKDLPGINTPLILASFEANTASTIHVEDALLPAINLLHCGAPKVWLIIPPGHREKFEEWVLKKFEVKNRGSSQFIRHRHFLVKPKDLKQQGIEHKVVVQEEGQLIFTAPGAYRQVLNMGKNLSVAINAQREGQSLVPGDYDWCQGKGRCDGSSLSASDVETRAEQ